MFTNVNCGSQPTKQGISPPSPTTHVQVSWGAYPLNRADFYRTSTLAPATIFDGAPCAQAWGVRCLAQTERRTDRCNESRSESGPAMSAWRSVPRLTPPRPLGLSDIRRVR